MCKDITDECIPVIKNALRSWCKEGVNEDLIQIVSGNFEQISMIMQHINPNYESYKRFLLSFEAKYGCLSVKCERVNWTSSRGSLEFCYKEDK